MRLFPLPVLLILLVIGATPTFAAQASPPTARAAADAMGKGQWVKVLAGQTALAVQLFRTSGALELLIGGLRSLVAGWGFDARWVDALPNGIMKSLSGSGARASVVSRGWM